MTRNERVRDLLAITGQLIACMDKEISLLRAMQPTEIQPLQGEKRVLADAYEAHFRALRSEEGGEDPISPELLGELTEATERFQSVLAENARALMVVKDVNDRVLKAIVEAVERDRVDAAGYTSGGAAPAQRRRGAAAQPMTVNQQF
ncbi:MAG: hypothetical protein BroJett029_38890 [Alphaproteobacteria bacterium]|nr:MAG: hypothetical protein BroJett029_38890 [Alphaproteobacteria bacterium]